MGAFSLIVVINLLNSIVDTSLPSDLTLKMQIFLNTLNGETRVSEVNDSLDALYTTAGIDMDNFYLSLGGVAVEDLDQLSENCTVDILARLPGGKVHGSLARAGKVRNQTPKVEKNTEKRKKLTGRAKRRAQYTKRFINVVVGPGKKRGPNSNQK